MSSSTLVGGKNADYCARRQKLIRHDSVKEFLRVFVKLASLAAHVRSVQDLGISSAQFPGLKERAPVDVRNDFLERDGIEHASASEARLRDVGLPPIDGRVAPARLFNGQQRLDLRTAMLFPQFFLLPLILLREFSSQLRAVQMTHHADGA